MNSQCDSFRSDSFQILHKGDSGESVSELQHLLNRQGSHLAADGQFGASTLTAVISFQQKKGLHVSGEVDESTWQILNA